VGVVRGAVVAEQGTSELAGLLAAGERAAFHGRPDAGVQPLRTAVELAVAEEMPAEAAAAGWLLGVCLSSAGRYGAALAVLEPVVAGAGSGADHETAEDRLLGALAAATVASIHRQLGRHSVAQGYDETALSVSDGAGEAGFDALLGLAADAVGLGDAGAAAERLQAAADLAEGRPEWWRQRVRLDWVRAEVALLEDRAQDAVAAAHAAVELAEHSGAPRHVAKGLLFQGVAQVQAGRVGEATATLRRAAILAESLGTVPLQWPVRAMLAALLAEDSPAESERSLAAARRAVQTVGDDLPDDLRADWLGRADVAAILA
jgi:tetratricopeptide (TPR) repeat protein